MLDVDMDVSGLVAAIAEAEGALSEELTRAVDAAVRAGADEARDNHPYTNRTGRLESRTRGRMTGPSEGVIEANTDYASFVEYGTSRARPYPFVEPAVRIANAVLEVETERGMTRVARILSK